MGVPNALAGAAGPVLCLRGCHTSINTFKNPDVLVTGGVFAISRNPMYPGFVLVLLGAAVIIDNAATLAMAALVFVASDLRYIRFELNQGSQKSAMNAPSAVPRKPSLHHVPAPYWLVPPQARHDAL